MTARMWLVAAAITLGATVTSFGQRQEVGLTMGTLVSQIRDLSGGRVENGRGRRSRQTTGCASWEGTGWRSTLRPISWRARSGR